MPGRSFLRSPSQARSCPAHEVTAQGTDPPGPAANRDPGPPRLAPTCAPCLLPAAPPPFSIQCRPSRPGPAHTAPHGPPPAHTASPDGRTCCLRVRGSRRWGGHCPRWFHPTRGGGVRQALFGLAAPAQPPSTFSRWTKSGTGLLLPVGPAHTKPLLSGQKESFHLSSPRQHPLQDKLDLIHFHVTGFSTLGYT